MSSTSEIQNFITQHVPREGDRVKAMKDLKKLRTTIVYEVRKEYRTAFKSADEATKILY